MPALPHLFSDHEEIRDIARQLGRAKVELDRSVLALRGWGRDVGQRLGGQADAIGHGVDLRALGETAGGLAHNFNNSLAAILAYTELLLREPQNDTSTRRLRVIRDVALEASTAVRRFQEFLSREPQVAFGPVGLTALVNEALEMTAPRWRDDAQRRGVSIAITQELDALPPVEANAFELRDALVELVLTATSAMSRGGTLAVRGWAEESGWVWLELADTGAGISAEAVELVREGPAGELAADHPARPFAAVAGVIERHGGTFALESAPGRGTTARLKLPASRFQIIPPSEEVLAPVPEEASARVLLVDDDQRLLTVLSDMLRSGGHQVTTAATGHEALAAFDPAVHDVVITDLGMPRMNGWEVAERIKERAPQAPVYLLTGWGEGVVTSEGSRYVDLVIAKPVSADALLGHLASLRRGGAPR